jgi:hypothetical protein
VRSILVGLGKVSTLGRQAGSGKADLRARLAAQRRAETDTPCRRGCMSGQDAEAELKAANATVKALENLIEIERLPRPDSSDYNAQEVRERKDELKKAKCRQ